MTLFQRKIVRLSHFRNFYFILLPIDYFTGLWLSYLVFIYSLYLVLICGQESVGLGSDSVWLCDGIYQVGFVWREELRKVQLIVRELAHWFGSLWGKDKGLEPQLQSPRARGALCLWTNAGWDSSRSGPVLRWDLLSGTESEAFPHSYCQSPSAVHWLKWEGPMGWDSWWIFNALLLSKLQDSTDLTSLNWEFSRPLVVISLDPRPTPLSKELWFPLRFYVFA